MGAWPVVYIAPQAVNKSSLGDPHPGSSPKLCYLVRPMPWLEFSPLFLDLQTSKPSIDRKSRMLPKDLYMGVLLSGPLLLHFSPTRTHTMAKQITLAII